MKKIFRNINFLLGASLLFGAVSCSGAKNENTQTSQPPKATENFFEAAKDAATGGELKLASDGKTNYKIVVNKGYSAAEEYAAEYLRDTLKDATDANFEIVFDDTLGTVDEKAYLISVGETSLSPNGPAVTAETLGREGFVVSLEGNTVYIQGGDDIGTVYGAQEFLSYTLDWEAYAYNCIYYNRVDNVLMPNIGTQTVIPDIKSAVTLSFRASLEELAIMRTRSNARMFGDLSTSLFNSTLCYHSIAGIAPESEYPQWYSNGQLCQTNEDAKVFIAERVAEIIMNAPLTEIYFELGNADAQKLCNNPTCSCSKTALENGGYGGLYVLWLNDVADKVQAHLEAAGKGDREYYLIGLMYQTYDSAPVVYNEATGKYEPLNENVVCRPNVGVRYCPINACYAHSLLDPDCEQNTSAQIEKNLYGWRALTDTYLMWTYDCEFYNYFAFFDNVASLNQNIKIISDLGVESWFSQIGGNLNRPFGSLRSYLSMKMRWDSSLDGGLLFDEFFENYYKEAAPYMLEYYNALKANIAVINQELGNNGCLVYGLSTGNYMAKAYWPITLLKNYEKIIDKAYAAIENADYSEEEEEAIKLRIRADEMLIDTFYIYGHQNYFTAEEYEEIKAAYIADNAKLRNPQYSEGVDLIK